jgi:hypothetical protein
MSAVPIPISSARAIDDAAPEVAVAVAGLAIAGLSHLIAVAISRKWQADPLDVLPALRPTPEELILMAPIVALLFARVPRKTQAWIALGFLVVWFGSRVLLALQVGRRAAVQSVPVPKPEPPKPAPRWKCIAARVRFWR